MDNIQVPYELFTIPLPLVPGVPNLPSQVFFYIDNRFSPREKIRIRNMIVSFIGQWVKHYIDKANLGISQLATCTDKYAERKLTPIWFNGIPFNSGADALNYAMDVVTSRIRDNGFRKVNSFIHYRVPPAGIQSTIFTFTSSEIERVSLTVWANPLVIQNETIPNLALAGSLFHAWLHRSGYTHPPEIYTSFLVAEAPMCVMRGYQDKVPGSPDSNQTRFFD